jgi:hypothetical protein
MPSLNYNNGLAGAYTYENTVNNEIIIKIKQSQKRMDHQCVVLVIHENL